MDTQNKVAWSTPEYMHAPTMHGQIPKTSLTVFSCLRSDWWRAVSAQVDLFRVG